MGSEGTGKGERYSSGGVGAGVTGLLLVAVVLASGAVEDPRGFPLWGWPSGVLAAVLLWAVMIRPAVYVGDDGVTLRNVFHDVWIPYGRITGIEVRQMTVVHVGEEAHACSGFGRRRRQITGDERRGPEASLEEYSLGWIVEEKVGRRAREANARLREDTEPPAVRRIPAWPEVVVAAGSALAAVVLGLLG